MGSLYTRFDAYHNQKVMLLENGNKSLRVKVKEQEGIINQYEKSKNDNIFRSSIDANKIIDCHIDEFISKELVRRSQLSEADEIKFSGVDVELDSMYELCRLVNENKIDKRSFVEAILNFDEFISFVKKRGKSLQILTSKFLAQKLVTKKPKFVSHSAQTYEDGEGDGEAEVDAYKDLEKRFKNANNKLGRLTGRCEMLQKEKENLKTRIYQLEFSLQVSEDNLKKADITIQSKRNDIKLLEDMITKVRMLLKFD